MKVIVRKDADGVAQNKLASLGVTVPENPQNFARMKVLNEKAVSEQQVVEWGMRAIQGSFTRLDLPIAFRNDQFQAKFIELAIFVYHLKSKRFIESLGKISIKFCLETSQEHVKSAMILMAGCDLPFYFPLFYKFF
ncbi:uncharacterized protein VP01_668g4 [Puccinia sorghi]|uniref:Uncharacterized protein n=1 Tax=Puccinia sorghi TaxID=27349 RepID=A0A0L6UEW4_9BASI|nr:uncharacterized protein VP01_668g4 [Puccinia sorghi]